MNSNQVKERYAHLAKEWGFTCKQVDESSKAIFHSHKETSTQKEFEEAMKQHLVDNCKPKNKK
jgi:hypothetical protein